MITILRDLPAFTRTYLRLKADRIRAEVLANDVVDYGGLAVELDYLKLEWATFLDALADALPGGRR